MNININFFAVVVIIISVTLPTVNSNPLASILNLTLNNLKSLIIGRQSEFCDENKYCAGHILCRKNWVAENQCRPNNVKLLKINKTRIVEYHNQKRSEVALGYYLPIPYAYRMPTVQWDSSLEEMAQARVLTCNDQHDKCLKTANFSRPGQNICGYSGGKTADEVTEICLTMWFNEIKDTTAEDINRYKTSNETIAHFTVMMQDRGDRVGCAMSQFKTNNVIMFCNYGFTNMRRERVYQSVLDLSQVGSGCLSGVNPSYDGLCNENEDIKNVSTANNGDNEEAILGS